MKRLLALFLWALPLAAQTVNHASAQGSNPAMMVTWTNPQVAGDTIIATVQPPGGTLIDLAGDAFVQDCVSGNFAIMRASNTAAIAANVLTYTPPAGSTYAALFANEQTGSLALDSCGSGVGTASVTAMPTTPTASGDLVYAFLSSAQCCAGTTVSAGMSFLNGLADTWWGAGFYSGWYIDAIGTPTGQGVTFTYPSSLGGGSGAAIMAAFKSVSAPQPVTLTFGPSTNPLTPCTDTVTYDDGSSLFSGQPAPESVMQLEGNAWVNIGTPVIQPNGQIVGSVAVNPSFTDNHGFIELQLLVQTIFNIPSMSALSMTPQQLQNGATGLCGAIVMYKGNQTLKYETFGLTP